MLAAVLASSMAATLGAQAGSAAAEAPGASSRASGPKSYYYDLGEDGQPIFTQVLQWEEDANALDYLVVVHDESGTELLRERTADPKKELRLPPGSYEYKIVTFNLLGKAEAETEWLKLEIIRAERPQIASAGPKVIYMDSLDGRITIVGEKLLSEGRVVLREKGEGGASFEGRELGRKGNEEIVVSFPDQAYQPGSYEISVENPGGLSSSLDDALRIRFQRPVDILAALGYSPFFPLYDSWFTASWPEGFNPLGFDAEIELFFVKARWGFLGIEGQAEYRRMIGGEAAALITSDYLLAGANALYKYRFTRLLHGLARVGGGLAFSKHSFDYEGFQGPLATSLDPFAKAGIALQAFTPKKLYAELGADWSCIFLKGHGAGGLTPTLRLGYQLF